MGIMVIAYPEISKEDLNRIENFREKNDRYFNIIRPHFTIVFPVYDLKQKDFIDHVKKISDKFSKINFTLRSAVTVKDSFSDYWDVLLTPDDGSSRIRKLHDALYTGILITELRMDIPYIPHMTVGNDIDAFQCYNLVNELNNADIAVKGAIKRLSIAWYDGKSLENIEDIELK